MSRDHTARTFKSGNSVALRLPKALGIKEGLVMTIREDADGLVVKLADVQSKKIDLTGIWGACPDLRPLTSEEREFEPSPRPWDDPDWNGWKPRE